MFTGIIEAKSRLVEKTVLGSGLRLKFESDIATELKVDQSLSHNGICLTVEEVNATSYWITAIEETIKKSNIGDLSIGEAVNIERCMPANGRFDGHIVQGHVDQVGICTSVEDKNGSWELIFQFDNTTGNIVVEKGSICVNGVSLTVVNASDDSFMVCIIPYTWAHTNLGQLKQGHKVNLEFDIIGKYLARLLNK